MKEDNKSLSWAGAGGPPPWIQPNGEDQSKKKVVLEGDLFLVEDLEEEEGEEDEYANDAEK